MDPFAQFKEAQKQGWAHFVPLEMHTTTSASRLVAHARIRPGQRVLDVACGTGVVAVTAARLGAIVEGVDLTPELLQRARENARIAKVRISWQEGDVEQLPLQDASFDVVLSQFGHMFAPRPELAVSEMLRVLKPGGTIAFSTWPPELLVGSLFQIQSQYGPPPPPGVAPPPLWGDPAVVRQRLGAGVKDILFDRGTMLVPALSPQHQRTLMEQFVGPIRKLVEMLSASDPALLAEFRARYDALLALYMTDNFVRQDYLMTRATRL